MKIYTKKGDLGKTSLFGGERVSKSNIRIDICGTLDELNAYIGLMNSQEIDLRHKDFLLNIQQQLFIIGAIIATPEEKNIKNKLGFDFNEKEITKLEQEIDDLDNNLEQMTHFILPGGHTVVSYCHIARTICRRAERKSVLLNEQKPINKAILSYLNRLSDYLFVLARMLSKELQVDEIKWIPSKRK